MPMLPSFVRDEATIMRPAPVSERGSTVSDYGDCSIVATVPCSIQPVSSASDWAAGERTATVRANAFFNPGTDVRRGDVVSSAGTSWLVDGVPHVWNSPTGRVSSITVQLVSWEG